jgi:hypothetical protein
MKQENSNELLEKNNQGDEIGDKQLDNLIEEKLEENDAKAGEEFIDEIRVEENEDKIKIKDQENNETKELISKEEKEEKKRLVDIIDRLKEDLDSEEYETLNQIYEQYLNNEDITKRYVDKTGECCLCLMFYILSPLFSMINLVAIFQSIYIMSTLSEVIVNTVPFFIRSLRNDPQSPFSIDDFNEKYNFYDKLMTRTLNEPFDFNLMLFMAFLGNALLKAKGLTFTLGIFCILINGAAFVLLYVFDFKDYDSEYNSFTL